jgi:hypothetical protein
MQEVLDEVIEKVATLTDEDRDKLIEFLQEKKNKNQNDGKKGYVSPNTIWVKEHHAEYAGNYVALKDGEFVGYGKTIKEADLKAKEKGVKNPLLHYIPAVDEEVWGGW